VTLTRTVVAAPQATAPVHSLVRSAITNVDNEPGWERGLAYAPETPGGYVSWMRCTTETFENLVEKTPVVEYEPVEFQFVHPCHSRFGLTEPQIDEELRRAVDATESFAIARELWQGDLTRAAVDAGDADAANLSLVDGPTVLNGGTPVKVHRALGMIEQALGEALRGQRAYVHLSRETLSLFGYLQAAGNLLTSWSGNLIVADARDRPDRRGGRRRDRVDLRNRTGRRPSLGAVRRRRRGRLPRHRDEYLHPTRLEDRRRDVRPSRAFRRPCRPERLTRGDPDQWQPAVRPDPCSRSGCASSASIGPAPRSSVRRTPT
jgi:hypothetical protein